jgi:hypothetical protein
LQATKERLAALSQGFDTFDEDMDVTTEKRKEREESKINKIKGEQIRLDKTLKSEIKKRVELSKELQNFCSRQIQSTDKQWTELMDMRSRAIHSRLQALEDRVTGLENDFSKARKEIPEDIAVRAENLGKLLLAFRDAFDVEQGKREIRERAISADLKGQNEATTEKFSQEMVRSSFFFCDCLFFWCMSLCCVRVNGWRPGLVS